MKESPKHPPHLSLRRPLRALTVWAVLSFAAAGQAADKKSAAPRPPVWPGADSAAQIREPIAEQFARVDEEWKAPLPAFLALDPGSGQRNILLPEVGSAGAASGSPSLVRLCMPAGSRVMFRGPNGALLAMANGGAEPSVQWATMRALPDRWDVRVTAGQDFLATDGVFLWVGAAPSRTSTSGSEGSVQPANPRTSGYAIRFETEAPALVLKSEGSRTRLRVVADGRIVAEVDASGRSTAASAYGVQLGEAKRRRIELLIDAGAVQSIETVDARHGFFLWRTTNPPVRMVVLGDGSAAGATKAFPWVTAARLDYECWSLAWGDGGTNLGAIGDMVPENLIAADLAATNADLVIITTRLMSGDGDTYAENVGRWLDAIAGAARPEAVKVVLPPFTLDPRDRRARALERAVKQRDMILLNWQGWLAGADAGVESLAAPDGSSLTPAGHEHVGSRLAEDLRKLELDVKLKVAAMRRQ